MSRILLVIILAVIIATLIPSFSSAAEGDHCRDILMNGIRDEYKIDTDIKFKQELERLLRLSDDQLQQESEKSSKSGGGSVTIPLAKAVLGVKGNGGATTDNSQLSRIRHRLQDDGTSSLQADEVSHITLSLVNAEIVKAWSDCMKSHNTVSLEPTFTQSGEFVIVSLKYHKDHGSDPDSIKLTSVTCPGLQPLGALNLTEGKSLGLEEVTQVYKRVDPTHEAVISINSERGAITQFIEPAQSPTKQVNGNDVLSFYKGFAESGKNAAATQGLYSDRVLLVWRPWKFEVDGKDIETRESNIYRLDDQDHIVKHVHLNDATSWEDTDSGLEPNRHYRYFVMGCEPKIKGIHRTQTGGISDSIISFKLSSSVDGKTTVTEAELQSVTHGALVSGSLSK